MERLPNKEALLDCIKDMMRLLKDVPFACLQVSVFATYVFQRKFPQNLIQVKAGDLFYKNYPLFRQNYSLNDIEDNVAIQNDWSGHAWVEIENFLIIEMSLSRTMRSNDAIESFEKNIPDVHNIVTGAMLIPKNKNYTDFIYSEKEVLSDRIIHGIAKGIEQDRKKYLNR